MGQHIGHMLELGPTVVREQAVVNEPEQIRFEIDVHAGNQSDADHYAVDAAAVLAAHQFDVPAAVLLEHCAVKQDVLPRTQHHLRSHLLPS